MNYFLIFVISVLQLMLFIFNIFYFRFQMFIFKFRCLFTNVSQIEIKYWISYNRSTQYFYINKIKIEKQNKKHRNSSTRIYIKHITFIEMSDAARMRKPIKDQTFSFGKAGVESHRTTTTTTTTSYKPQSDSEKMRKPITDQPFSFGRVGVFK